MPALIISALALGACGSSSSTTSSSVNTATSSSAAVVGKSTSLVINPATAQLLQQNEIIVSAVAPAKVSTAIVLPTTSGHFVVSSATGTIGDSGGVKLSHAGKSVQLTSFVIDTESKQVTARIAGKRVPVFDLALSSVAHTTGPSGTAVFSGVKLSLSEEAATALNSGLGVSAFKSGQEFGVATLSIAVA